jgi:iron complex outermembrane receptor protein
MKTKYIIIIFFLSMVASLFAETPTDKLSLRGKVTDEINGSALMGVNIYFPELKKGTVTDDKGHYFITDLPAVTTTVQVSYVGHQTIAQAVNLKTTGNLDFVLKESDARINEVVITALTGNALIKRTPSPISYVSGKELEGRSATNIIDAIAKQPGISQITTGSSISKPVIRGLGYNRVVVVNDGIRQEGQQWGDEHGIEIDPHTVYSVEILKGPASLMYGSDAMAGVINFQSDPILPQGMMKANVATEYQTNNGLFNYSLNYAGNKSGFVWNWRYSDKMAHTYQNRYDGYVYGSGFRERAVSGLFGLSRSWGYSHLTLDYYHLTPGIVEGERDEATGKFLKPVVIDGEEDEAVATDKDGRSYAHPMPYQQIYHYKAALNNNFIIGEGNLRAIVGYQQNRRQEFEDILTPDNYGLYFQLHTVNYDLRYTFPEMGGYKLVTGVNGMYQKSLNKGSEFLIPAYHLFDAGVFVLASRNFDKMDVSGGIRFDHRSNHSEALYLNAGEEPVDRNAEGAEEKFPGFSRQFQGVSGSLGFTYQFSDAWHTKLNLSKGFRAPNISELASNGVHEGTIRYEKGNSDLKAENSWQADWGIGYSSSFLSIELSLFANRIDNYIFSHKITDDKGNDLLTEGYRTYQFVSGDARILGGEASIDIHPVERLHFQNTFSYVNSVQLNQSDSTKYLPYTPAPKGISELRYDLIRHGKILNNTYISLELEYNLRQDHIYSAFNTETVTPAYVLLNAAFGTDFMCKGRTVASLYFTADNLTDRAYQNHLSRLKYADENPVTGRTGVYNMGRNFGVKLIVPLVFK